MNKDNDNNIELKGIYEQVMMPNYAPADFIPDRALGSKVWDKNNKEYNPKYAYPTICKKSYVRIP